VATHGPELTDIARQNNISYLFEASVGGGIPIIRPLKQCLAANDIDEIYGILNGTSNYILTMMREEGKSFAEALKEAQDKGYAENNPSADIEGHDTCRKMSILSWIAFG
jgi:homoserine dehydrogenase